MEGKELLAPTTETTRCVLTACIDLEASYNRVSRELLCMESAGDIWSKMMRFTIVR